MENPIDPNNTRFDNATIVKLKAYLMDTVAHEFNQFSTTPTERETVVREGLTKAYEQTGLKLPESLRIQLFHDIIDEMVGFGPIQSLLDDPE
ncbi:MAG: hypothetical protein WAM09_18655, partial [Anaerolineales bacterium]